MVKDYEKCQKVLRSEKLEYKIQKSGEGVKGKLNNLKDKIISVKE